MNGNVDRISSLQLIPYFHEFSSMPARTLFSKGYLIVYHFMNKDTSQPLLVPINISCNADARVDYLIVLIKPSIVEHADKKHLFTAKGG